MVLISGCTWMSRLWVLLFLIALCFAVGYGTARADESGEHLLAKYRSFMGWNLGDATVNAIRISGRIADQSTFDEICKPSRFAQYNVGLQSGRSFLVESDEGSGWISHQGKAKDLQPSVAQDVFTQSLLLCNAFGSYPATLVSNIAGSGKWPMGFGVVALSIPREPTVLLAINKQTGELTSVVVDGTASYDVAGLRNIDATHRIYTRWKRKLPDDTTADMVITAVQLNVQVDETIFARSTQDTPPPRDAVPPVTF